MGFSHSLRKPNSGIIKCVLIPELPLLTIGTVACNGKPALLIQTVPSSTLMFAPNWPQIRIASLISLQSNELVNTDSPLASKANIKARMLCDLELGGVTSPDKLDVFCTNKCELI
jgi:hypothetical protein